MYDKILVPLDGSKRAEAILPHVQKVALSGRSKVILLTALEHKMTTNQMHVQSRTSTDEANQQIRSAETYLENLTEELHQMDIQAESKVIFGSPVEMIINVAEEEDVGLIAIASHGRGGLARVFYGSIAAGVLQAVDRPLLLIRSRNI